MTGTGTQQEQTEKKVLNLKAAYKSVTKGLSALLWIPIVGLVAFVLYSLGMVWAMFLIIIAFTAWKSTPLFEAAHRIATTEGSQKAIRSAAEWCETTAGRLPHNIASFGIILLAGAVACMTWGLSLLGGWLFAAGLVVLVLASPRILAALLEDLAGWAESDRSTEQTLVAKASGTARVTAGLLAVFTVLMCIGFVFMMLSIGRGPVLFGGELLAVPQVFVLAVTLVVTVLIFRDYAVAAAAGTITLFLFLANFAGGNEGMSSVFDVLGDPARTFIVVLAGLVLVLGLSLAFALIIREKQKLRKRADEQAEHEEEESESEDAKRDNLRARRRATARLTDDTLREREENEQEEEERELDEARDTRHAQSRAEVVFRKMEAVRISGTIRMVVAVLLYMSLCFVIGWMRWRDELQLTANDMGEKSPVSPLYMAIYQALAVAVLWYLVRRLTVLAEAKRDYALEQHQVNLLAEQFKEEAEARVAAEREAAKESADEAEQDEVAREAEEADRLREARQFEAAQKAALLTVWNAEVAGANPYTQQDKKKVWDWTSLAEHGLTKDANEKKFEALGVTPGSYHAWAREVLYRSLTEGNKEESIFDDDFLFKGDRLADLELTPQMLKKHGIQPHDIVQPQPA